MSSGASASPAPTACRSWPGRGATATGATRRARPGDRRHPAGRGGPGRDRDTAAVGAGARSGRPLQPLGPRGCCSRADRARRWGSPASPSAAGSVSSAASTDSPATTESVDIVTADAGASPPTADPTRTCTGRRGGGRRQLRRGHLVHLAPPHPRLALFTLEFPWARRPTSSGRGRRGCPARPDELWSNCQLLSVGPRRARSAGSRRLLAGTRPALTAPRRTAGRRGGHRAHLPVRRPRAPTCRPCSSRPDARDSTWPSATCPSQNPAGTLARRPPRRSRPIIESPCPRPASTPWSTWWTTRPDPARLGGGIVFDSYGGAINASSRPTPPSSTATRCAGIEYSVAPGAAPRRRWPGPVVAASRPGRLAPSQRGPTRTTSTPPWPTGSRPTTGPTCPAWSTVKRAYDPDDVFHFAQSIPTSLS